MKDDLRKFLDAQNAPGYAGYANAVKELSHGKKLSPWIWYVFPQLKSISQNSPYEKKYGIDNLEEAREYLQNSTLKSRLDEVCMILMSHQGKTASSIFGMTDAAKVKSSMTLFFLASKDELYRQVLDKYYNGLPCQKTLYALNLTMPSRGTVSSQGIIQGKEVYVKHRTNGNIASASKQSNTFSNNSGRKSSKARKTKKLMILIVGIIVIVGTFSGLAYGAYTLFSQDTPQAPITENVGKPTVSDKCLAVVLRSSDRELIGKEEIEKYFIHVSASLGDKTCVMDTISNSYNFKFTDENSNEAITLNVAIEDCTIGEAIYVYNDLDTSNDNIEESVVLTVSSTDLRIYEELAWYISAKQQVAEVKYDKYVERIKAVKDEKFATLLIERLNSIGKATPKLVDGKEKVRKKDNDNLTDEVMDRVRHGVKIPGSLLENLTPHQRAIIHEYNYFIGKMHKNKKVLYELRLCRTFDDIKYILRSSKWIERE